MAFNQNDTLDPDIILEQALEQRTQVIRGIAPELTQMQALMAMLLLNMVIQKVFVRTISVAGSGIRLLTGTRSKKRKKKR